MKNLHYLINIGLINALNILALIVSAIKSKLFISKALKKVLSLINLSKL